MSTLSVWVCHTVILQFFGALKFRFRAITERSVSFKFRCPWVLSWPLNVFFSFWRLFDFGKTTDLTTENTENKTTPKNCKITCARTARMHDAVWGRCHNITTKWRVKLSFDRYRTSSDSVATASVSCVLLGFSVVIDSRAKALLFVVGFHQQLLVHCLHLIGELRCCLKRCKCTRILCAGLVTVVGRQFEIMPPTIENDARYGRSNLFSLWRVLEPSPTRSILFAAVAVLPRAPAQSGIERPLEGELLFKYTSAQFLPISISCLGHLNLGFLLQSGSYLSGEVLQQPSGHSVRPQVSRLSVWTESVSWQPSSFIIHSWCRRLSFIQNTWFYSIASGRCKKTLVSEHGRR